MATLLLRIAAPLQAWGSNSKFNIRTTEREPTKSGIIGMIASAMGIQREDNPEVLQPLTALKFGVRVEQEGQLLKDFHVVRPMIGGKLKTPDVTTRYYLSDAVFLVALESDNTDLLHQIGDALQHPVYPLYLGRRSCPLTLPVFLGIRKDNFITVLHEEKGLLKDMTNESSERYIPTRIIYDVSENGTIVKDVPLSFSQLHRQHGFRMQKEELFISDEHDPFSEL